MVQTADKHGSIAEKRRIRSQINAQVEEFLRQGGRVTTCDNSPCYKEGRRVGQVWLDPDPALPLKEE